MGGVLSGSKLFWLYKQAKQRRRMKAHLHSKMTEMWLVGHCLGMTPFCLAQGQHLWLHVATNNQVTSHWAMTPTNVVSDYFKIKTFQQGHAIVHVIVYVSSNRTCLIKMSNLNDCVYKVQALMFFVHVSAYFKIKTFQKQSPENCTRLLWICLNWISMCFLQIYITVPTCVHLFFVYKTIALSRNVFKVNVFECGMSERFVRPKTGLKPSDNCHWPFKGGTSILPYLYDIV